MRRYFTRLVIINAVICAIFGAPIRELEAGFVLGLVIPNSGHIGGMRTVPDEYAQRVGQFLNIAWGLGERQD